MSAVLFAGICCAALVSFFAARLVIPALKRNGLVDIPSARSSHRDVVARGGGFAVGCGVTAGSVLVAALGVAGNVFTAVTAATIIGGFLIFTWCFSILGFTDDLGSLSAGLRLSLQILISGAFVFALALLHGLGAFGLIAATAAVVFVVNATNFMDGLNGLTSSWAVVLGVWYCCVFAVIDEPAGAGLAAVLAAAAAGFLPYNIGTAQAFLGDVGSYGVGAAAAALAAVLISTGIDPIVVFAPLMLLTFDVGITLLRRLYGRENIFQAHRGHIYQRLQQQGLSHEQTSGVYAGLTAVGCAATLPILFTAAPAARVSALAALAGIAALYMQMPRLAGALCGRSAEVTR